ncbi:MAG: metallophosphoesterase [Vicinamibacterales bacterium]
MKQDTSTSQPPAAQIDQRAVRGPFDIIGDIHGCASEVADLLALLGYTQNRAGVWGSTSGRTAVFIGDLVDRGPQNVDAVRLVMSMVQAGHGFCVPGNHDLQLTAYLSGAPVPIVYGLDVTLREMDRESPESRSEIQGFFERLPSHYLFDDGRLVIAHTGLPEALHGVDTPEVRRLAAYGTAEGETDPGDIAQRHSWVDLYRGTASVVFGHTRVLEPIWRNNTIDIDTGCVYGWRLTALQWPERRLLSVPARQPYVRSTRPFLPAGQVPATS